MKFRASTIAATAAASVPLVLTGSAVAGNPHGTAPGQAKQEQKAAAPETKHADNGTRNHGAGRTAPKPAKPQKAKAPKPAKAPKATAPKTYGPAGKTTICHATGSATNPFVTITISNNALPAHTRHQDSRDIVPAPADGCPAAPAAPTAPAASSANPASTGKTHTKVTLCHATGSDTNPFVTITIAEPAVAAHRRHQHQEDVIPAPAEGCPAAPAASTTTRTVPGLGLQTNAPGAAVLGETVAGGPADDAGVLAGARLGAGSPADAGEVAGETVGGGSDAAPAARRESGADAPAAASRLPFTGLDLALIVALGLGALLGGVALRRSLATRRTTA